MDLKNLFKPKTTTRQHRLTPEVYVRLRLQTQQIQEAQAALTARAHQEVTAALAAAGLDASKNYTLDDKTMTATEIPTTPVAS